MHRATKQQNRQQLSATRHNFCCVTLLIILLFRLVLHRRMLLRNYGVIFVISCSAFLVNSKYTNTVAMAATFQYVITDE